MPANRRTYAAASGLRSVRSRALIAIRTALARGLCHFIVRRSRHRPDRLQEAAMDELMALSAGPDAGVRLGWIGPRDTYIDLNAFLALVRAHGTKMGNVSRQRLVEALVECGLLLLLQDGENARHHTVKLHAVPVSLNVWSFDTVQLARRLRPRVSKAFREAGDIESLPELLEAAVALTAPAAPDAPVPAPDGSWRARAWRAHQALGDALTEARTVEDVSLLAYIRSRFAAGTTVQDLTSEFLGTLVLAMRTQPQEG